MTAKRFLALLVAMLMFVALFSACANGDDNANQPGDTGNSGDTGDVGNTGDADDNPSETEPLKLTYMGSETHNWSYTLEEAIAAGFETWD